MLFVAYYRQGVLVPMDSTQAEEFEAHLPKNVPLAVEVNENRNIDNHRRFFAFLNKAVNMQEHYTNVDQMRFALFIKAGHCQQVVSHKNGKISFIPKSMKFDKMSETKFRKVFKDCLDAFHDMLQEMGRDISEDELYQLMEFE